MLHFLADYGLFLLKTATLVIAILFATAGLFAIASRNKGKTKEKFEIKKLNERYKAIEHAVQQEILPKAAYKKLLKNEKKLLKERKKADTESTKRIFVINFSGDIRASEVNLLREEISAILSCAKPTDEVFVTVESGGGMVHSYGLAASQLARIRQQNIPLTVAVDKVAASGGYLMACVANKIIAAPFAIIGSIGVVAQLPNFNRWLKKNGIDFEMITAGEFKRTLTIFGENTDKAREKMKEDVQEIQNLFKDFIKQYRAQVNIDEVATGEHWMATDAHKLKLVDAIQTSDDYLLTASKDFDLYHISYEVKKNISERLAKSTAMMVGKVANAVNWVG